MKFSAQEEYGLRCLLRISKADSPNGLTIPEISQLEDLSAAHVGKILRILRLGGFVDSTRGQTGGYKLTRTASQIIIGDVLNVLGGKLFESSFCEEHSGLGTICTHTIDCSIRSLWNTVQSLLDSVLGKMTLQDLIGTEYNTKVIAGSFADEAVDN
ncbi:MAG: Rrf2 family transcriptional regulator [Ignavibacteriaceae bacterium]|nr:Rrf2 family transcriptional regulator [Ignavibacteriaceae bacterium]